MFLVPPPLRHGRGLVYITNHVIARILFSRIRLWWYRRVMRFEIGQHSSILTDFKVAQMSNLTIGDHTVINNSCRFDNRFPIRLGNNVSITYGAMILTKGHDMDSPDFRTQGAPVTVDDYAWICANAIILPGVSIGKGTVVLTGSVVTRDVPPFHVVGGNPAVFVRERSRDLQYSLHFDPWVPFFG
ncbi:MAG: acyltransferase [Chloroflexi bacterium]|nr:acyltransferase [Chloroflexota bacterium]